MATGNPITAAISISLSIVHEPERIQKNILEQTKYLKEVSKRASKIISSNIGILLFLYLCLPFVFSFQLFGFHSSSLFLQLIFAQRGNGRYGLKHFGWLLRPNMVSSSFALVYTIQLSPHINHRFIFLVAYNRTERLDHWKLWLTPAAITSN